MAFCLILLNDLPFYVPNAFVLNDSLAFTNAVEQSSFSYTPIITAKESSLSVSIRVPVAISDAPFVQEFNILKTLMQSIALLTGRRSNPLSGPFLQQYGAYAGFFGLGVFQAGTLTSITFAFNNADQTEELDFVISPFNFFESFESPTELPEIVIRG